MRMLSGCGEIAIALSKAAGLHAPFPADVPDTPENRELFADIQAAQEDMLARGIMPMIPKE